MTVLEACDKIDEAINDLHPETLAGWDLSYTADHTDEEHVENYKESLAKTREHFGMEGPTSAWFVSTPEDAILAWCGNSPTAAARAKYIAWVNPQNIQLLIARIRELESKVA
jgi:hypothetical protein